MCAVKSQLRGFWLFESDCTQLCKYIHILEAVISCERLVAAMKEDGLTTSATPTLKLARANSMSSLQHIEATTSIGMVTSPVHKTPPSSPVPLAQPDGKKLS